jgi:nucleotide-binding universal stress UspA family protein
MTHTPNRPSADRVSEIVVPTADPDHADAAASVAAALAGRLGVEVRTVHADATEVVDAIVESLTPTSVAVMQSEHVNRWSGKRSVAEHVLDTWGGLTVLVGPAFVDVLRSGPVLVAVGNPAAADQSVEPAAHLAAALGVELLVVHVVADPIIDDGGPPVGAPAWLDTITAEGGHATTVVESNDVVGAVLDLATELASACVVVASRGDRTTPRPTMSRTCSGLAAGAEQPVAVIGPRAASLA